jgi:YD repeat-containing protein
VLTTGTIAGTITKYSDGTPLSGALVEALQSNVVISSTTSAANGSYSIGSLAPGTYDARVSATGYATKLTSGISVVAGGTNTVNVVLVPQPATTNLSPASGLVGTAVTVSGLNFGATQGTSSITFNGVAATPTSWSASSIVAAVPAGVTTGSVVVTVAGALSNSVTFTVLFTGGIAGTITHAGDSVPIGGALIEAIQSGVVKASANSAANGTYSISNAVQGTYDVRVSASGYVTKLTIGITVPPNATTTVGVALSRPGTISGKVTQLDGITPIAGAAVEVSQGTTTAGTATTNATGDYSVAGLNPGTYSVQSSAIGYRVQNVAGVAVSENTATASNFSLEAAPPSAGISYIYDKLGRLIGAVDLSGDTARYTYDEVGNLLSISRLPSSQVSIIEFTPASGTVGASVTIYGTGFSATPSQNTVTFNGAAASINSATATEIVTSVPSGAATGPIAVTSPSGSATSSTPFTLAGSSGAPTITGFSPTVGTAATVVTITGTNFESAPTNNKVRFNIGNSLVRSASAFSISGAVPPAKAASGPISVATPAGKAVGGDFFIPPSPYTAADVEVTGRMSIGESRVVTIGTANKIGLIVFDGTEGQRLSVYESHSFSQGCETLRVSVQRPDGTELVFAAGCFGSALIEPVSLPVTGTYTLVVDPLGTLTGQATIILYNVVDITGTITPSGPAVNVNIVTPGQRALYSFSGIAGQRVSALESHSFSQACESVRLSIQKPDGTELTFAAGCFGSSFIEPLSLPITGTYKVIVDLSGANTGQATVNLYDVVDITGPITPSGPSVNVNITTPGHRGLLDFNGSVGQRVSAYATHSISQACDTAYLRLLKPDGAELPFGGGCFGSLYLDTQTLPVAGTYKLVFDPVGARTGLGTLNLYDVVDVTGTVTIGGPVVNVTITGLGQNAQITFDGTVNQQVTIHVTNNTIHDVTVKLFRPDGSVLTSITADSGTFNLPTQTLPTTGTYTISIDPPVSNTGSMNLSVTSP